MSSKPAAAFLDFATFLAGGDFRRVA